MREAAFAIAQQNGNVTAFKVRSDDIRESVLISISGANSLIRHLADRKRNSGRRKVPLAVAKHDGHAIVSPIVDHKIQIVVAVEIPKSDAMRMRATVDGEGRLRRWCECPVAVAEQHRNVMRVVIRERQIEIAIAIHVTDRDVIRTIPCGKR